MLFSSVAIIEGVNSTKKKHNDSMMPLPAGGATISAAVRSAHLSGGSAILL